MSSLFTRDELERYSKKFICFLYESTSGDLNKGHKAIDIFFQAISTGAYERPSYGYQATNEIVRNLTAEGLVEIISTSDVRLTSNGLEKCKKECR
jgi:hypothetical protein